MSDLSMWRFPGWIGSEKSEYTPLPAPLCGTRRVGLSDEVTSRSPQRIACPEYAQPYRLLDKVGLAFARAACRCVRADAADHGQPRESDSCDGVAGLRPRRLAAVDRPGWRLPGHAAGSADRRIADRACTGRARLPRYRRPL